MKKKKKKKNKKNRFVNAFLCKRIKYLSMLNGKYQSLKKMYIKQK